MGCRDEKEGHVLVPWIVCLEEKILASAAFNASHTCWYLILHTTAKGTGILSSFSQVTAWHSAEEGGAMFPVIYVMKLEGLLSPGSEWQEERKGEFFIFSEWKCLIWTDTLFQLTGLPSRWLAALHCYALIGHIFNIQFCGWASIVSERQVGLQGGTLEYIYPYWDCKSDSNSRELNAPCTFQYLLFISMEPFFY